MDDIEVGTLIGAWAAAEERGDSDAIDGLTAPDFTAVGPRGFVLDKTAWLERYRSGGLRNRTFTVESRSERHFGDCAVVIGSQRQTGEYDGHDVSGAFTATLIATRRDDRWLLAGVHLSPAMQQG